MSIDPQREPDPMQPSSGEAVAPGPTETPGFDPPTLLVWFGVAGGAIAWAAVHVIGVGASFNRCIPTGTGSSLSLSPVQIAVAACGAAVALGAMSVCVWIFMRTFRIGDVAAMERRGDGSPPPPGRLQFLAMAGLTVNLLALAIIVLDGVGAPLLHACQQS